MEAGAQKNSMTYTERKEKEKHLLYLIEHERLISLDKIANDYCCSKRTIRRMINNLRDERHNIIFCRKCNKYVLKK